MDDHGSVYGDDNDLAEEEAEGENDSVFEVDISDNGDNNTGESTDLENDEDEVDDTLLKEMILESETMISQTVVFVLHGVLRNASDYCRNWIALAEKFNLLIICPEFQDNSECFPNTSYNFGGIEKERGGKNSKNWAFTSLEGIFDLFLLAGVNKEGYTLFGHSAGAQFAHRFMLFSGKKCRCIQAVAANAGWYTQASIKEDWVNAATTTNGGDVDFKWPYSLVGAPVKYSIEQLILAFSRKLIVMIGQEDVGLKYLRVTPAASAQGPNRFIRGLTFFTNAHKTARELNVPFHWQLLTVPNVGHSNKHMAFFASSMLFRVLPTVTSVTPNTSANNNDHESANAKDGPSLHSLLTDVSDEVN